MPKGFEVSHPETHVSLNILITAHRHTDFPEVIDQLLEDGHQVFLKLTFGHSQKLQQTLQVRKSYFGERNHPQLFEEKEKEEQGKHLIFWQKERLYQHFFTAEEDFNCFFDKVRLSNQLSNLHISG